MNEVKVGKLPIIASYTCNLFQNFFKGAKKWWLFAKLYKNSTTVQKFHCLFSVGSLNYE